MITSLNTSDIYTIIVRVADVIVRNKDYLTQLDAAIGDGDHGINMDRGFELAVERLKQLDINNSDIGTILMTVANALLEVVGGAAGPLYGMFFMNMATVASGKKEVDLQTLTTMFEQGLRGVQDIGGGTQPGEKTMVDTLYPFVEELKKQAASNSNDIALAFANALKAAENGMIATINMIAKKGRASYLGPRSVGHQDPGATSSYLILKTFYDYIKEKESKG